MIKKLKLLFCGKTIFDLNRLTPDFETINFGNSGRIVEDEDNIIYSFSFEKIYTNYVSKLIPSTTILLKSKGFETSLNSNCDEKIVLLITEISELADAVKKGTGMDEELFEVADIVIRTCNFLIADEMQLNMKYIENNFNSIFKIKETTISVSKNKYSIIRKMHNIVYELENIKGLDNEIKDINLKTAAKILSNVILLIAICEAYSLFVLKDKENINLHNFINGKMNYNFERPYKYNTSEECR